MASPRPRHALSSPAARALIAGLLAACGPAGPGPPVEWTERVEVDAGAGRVGPWRMNESDWRYVDDPAVGVDGEGRTAVVWVDQSRKDVLLQIYGPDGAPRFATPTNVSRTPGVFSWLPRVVLARSGGGARVHVLWQEIVFSGGTHGGEAFYARSTDGGASFEAPVNLSRSPEGDGKGRLTPDRWDNGSLDLARGPGGRLYAAWTEYEGALWLRRSSDGGESFRAPLRVAGSDTLPARAPSLAPGADGTVYLAWTVGGREGADVRFAVSRDGGRSFVDPRIVHPGDGHSDAPRIAVDAGGRVHLVYAESPAGPLRRYHVRYARSPGGTTGFGEPRRISGVADGRFESEQYPRIALGPGGTVLVAWDLRPEGERLPRGLGVTVSRDGGGHFSAPRVVPGSARRELGVTGSLQGALMEPLAIGPAGEVVLAQSTIRPGEESHVWLHRGSLR